MQIKDLGSGSFGECKLARDHDGEAVAVKFIERCKVRVVVIVLLVALSDLCLNPMFSRGWYSNLRHKKLLQVDKNVKREVLMHSSLSHPNVIGFKRVCPTALPQALLPAALAHPIDTLHPSCTAIV